MKKQAEFGTGIHRVKFIWETAYKEKYYVQYRASTRRGVARILRKFLKALKQLNIAVQNASLKKATKDAVPFGYTWLAARSPKCEIHTKNKYTDEPIKLSHSFTYLFPNTSSFRGLWERIILGTNTHHQGE